MDKNEIPRSSGGASSPGAPPAPISTQIQVSWTPAARQAPLSAAPDATPIAARTRTARAALNRAVKHAVGQTLRQAPLKVETGAAKDVTHAAPRALEVDLSFVSDDEIAELNSNYRGKPKPTDVLSFSQREDDELIPMQASADDDTGENGDSPVMLGDIIISIETAQRQAVELKHDLLTEVTFLAVHGALHLCGYDHGTASERRTMWKWQEKIVASLPPGGTANTLNIEQTSSGKRRKTPAAA